MSDASGSPSGREYGRVLFVCGCALALVLSSALLPAVAAPFGQTPVESLFAGQQAERLGGDLGALNPGQETTVGGLQTGDGRAFRSQSTAVHFLVEATEPGYWRTGAYDTYTGSGWQRSGETTTEAESLAVDGLVNRTVSYEVRLNRSASALPTVWRPQRIATDAQFGVTPQRAIRAESPLSPGTTYRATSAVPPRDPAVLSTAGRDYPLAIEQRYTQLPGVANTRLESFTDRLTADAETPYETATQIEQWLETNKSYSLNVSRPDGDSIASDFVFEMDAGYCEYFATSMVAMLRTQGVPARYVVGYSTGQRTGENTYTVRGMNAHAWVEVYFPDVGWVRFDPTPGSDRLDAERQTLQRQRPGAGSYNHTEEGSPGETFSPNDTDPDLSAEIPDGILEGPNSDNSTEDSAAGTDGNIYDVTLSTEPVPGRFVMVTVERDGDPVTDAVVSFNGQSIGQTGWTGQVKGVVPYAEQLNVTVRVNETEGVVIPENGTDIDWDATSSAVPFEPRRAIGDAEMLYAVEPGGPDTLYATELGGLSERPRPTMRANNTTRRTYDLPTDAALSLSGTVATGQDVLLTVTVDGQPVPAATVERDGTAVGTTDARGRLELTLPEEPGEVTLSASRGAVAGNRTLTLAALRLDVESRAPVALPWTGVTVTARLGNETAAGVPVSIDGERVGTTGVDGRLTTALPFDDSATVAVAEYGQRETVTVDGLFVRLGVLALTAGTLLVGVALVVRRRDLATGRLLDWTVVAVRSVPAVLVGGLVAVADGLTRVGSRVRDGLARSLARTRSLVAGEISPRELLVRTRSWLASAVTAIRGGREPAPQSVDDTDYVTIREGWAMFLETVSVRNPETMTPEELAIHAVERDGLPPEAVRSLRDAFRAVEYGARPPDAHCRAVEEAVDRLHREGRE